jgi:ZIP family zinc transporter
MNSVFYCFIISTIGGLSTLLAYLIIIFLKRPSNNIVLISLAFAAGIMISVSLIDLIPNAFYKINTTYSFFITIIYLLIFFIVGVIITFLLDKYLPDNNIYPSNNKLYHIGFISLIAIILHNIPEGMITFMVNTTNIKLGLIITTSIILHNIPEGISIIVPIYYSTGNKTLTFYYCLIASLSEPFGALITYLFFYRYINDLLIGFLFAVIAGIMIRISTKELLPTSLSYQNKKLTIVSFLTGLFFMIIVHLF